MAMFPKNAHGAAIADCRSPIADHRPPFNKWKRSAEAAVAHILGLVWDPPNQPQNLKKIRISNKMAA